MLKDLIVFQKTYDLLKWIHELTAKYPKSEKFVPAARTENGVLDLLEAGSRMNDELGRLLGGLRKRFGGAAPDVAATPKG
ncbi:MAG TPA: hypothetical protein DCZ01_01310 [Elusimicrobia bacterium]|nr:MAG: hypothetical protein A2X37_06925 [Elusimicrobia bacterium GWA2_66_18]OGR73948.1 MAG: hypothetical protein A2X40_01820 [Elusimicrobia bacterium GWC2_65_9]HAZ07171.1 hypothetical protein [Elusimicrobiota bacterium]